ncbi:hypothetical protein [Terrimonas alba]|uniref:hypothetical protein n=1 Tax=Terrimonas alba TaxID=3349636 RepID=UPI0035F4CAF2
MTKQLWWKKWHIKDTTNVRLYPGVFSNTVAKDVHLGAFAPAGASKKIKAPTWLHASEL